MKVRREVLKSRTTLLLAGAMAIAAGSSSGAWAADVSPISPPPEGWYFNGELEAGVRAFIQRPPSGFGYNSNGNFLLPTQTDSRAKFQEYGEIRPGLFLDWIYLEAGSNDGRYRFNFLGKDVGYNAQKYEFDFSEAGRQYLTLGWDQTPHLYSTSAKSLFSGVGSTNLTVSDNVQSQLKALFGCAAVSGNCPPGSPQPTGVATRNAINNVIESNATHIDEIGTQRDTFSAGYRITPTPDWDFNVSYSHEDRTGTKPGTLNYTSPPGFPSNVIGVPVPVDDTTHTPEASGEYAGTGPWGRYNVKVGYAGSVYTDNLTTLTVDNPFGVTGNITPTTPTPPFGTLRLPLPPSNQAHAFTASGATDVPLFKSRFMTTNQFSRWTQDDAFIGTSNNGLIVPPLPVSSLNGEVVNFLSNNVLTSALTDNLHNKVRVRYYEHENRTTQIQPIGAPVLADSEKQTLDADELPPIPEYTSYQKTNVNDELTWHPWRWLTVGAGYEFERWHRSDNRFATLTNEHIGSMFADTQLTNWAKWRVSYSYGARRYNDYTIDDNSWLNTRMFDLADRNQQKARTLLDIDVTDAITLTPNAGLRWDDYPETTPFQTGLSSDHSWNAGIDVGWVVSPTFRLNAGYNYEQAKLDMSAVVPDAAGAAAGNACNFPGYPPPDFAPYTAPPRCGWGDNLTTTYHTLIASADWKAIPSKLDFRLSYVASWEREAHDFTPCPGNYTNCNGSGITGVTPSQVGLPWPDNTALYQRFDAIARYYVDPDLVRQLGWKGKVVAKLRYSFERNSGAFWQSDALNAYFGTLTGTTELTGASRSIWLAYNNPNYTAQIIAASIAVKW